MVREILLLGDERLYEICDEVTAEDAPLLPGWIEDLHDTLLDYRAAHGAGRAVAAPQIGRSLRLVVMDVPPGRNAQTMHVQIHQFHIFCRNLNTMMTVRKNLVILPLSLGDLLGIAVVGDSQIG